MHITTFYILLCTSFELGCLSLFQPGAEIIIGGREKSSITQQKMAREWKGTSVCRLVHISKVLALLI